jgi:hypothetical protein
MIPPSPLDDAATAAHAWGRFRRQIRLTCWATAGVVPVALALIYARYGMISIHLYIATALGLTFGILLISALAGLAFLSSGTGHDQAVASRHGNDPGP